MTLKHEIMIIAALVAVVLAASHLIENDGASLALLAHGFLTSS